MKKVCKREPEVLNSLMAGKDGSRVKKHLSECQLCRETRDLFLMMRTVERNTRRSPGFSSKKFPDPRILLDQVAGEKDQAHKARQRILSVLKWPRHFALLATTGGLAILLGGDPGSGWPWLSSLRAMLQELPKEIFRGWLVPITLLPLLLLTGFLLIDMAFSRRERRHYLQTH